MSTAWVADFARLRLDNFFESPLLRPVEVSDFLLLTLRAMRGFFLRADDKLGEALVLVARVSFYLSSERNSAIIRFI